MLTPFQFLTLSHGCTGVPPDGAYFSLEYYVSAVDAGGLTLL